MSLYTEKLPFNRKTGLDRLVLLLFAVCVTLRSLWYGVGCSEVPRSVLCMAVSTLVFSHLGWYFVVVVKLLLVILPPEM